MKIYIDWERLSSYLSRQIDKAEKDDNKSQMKFWHKVYGIMQDFADIEQEPKAGHWIIVDDCEKFIAKCSECGRIEDSRMIKNYPYCHCGARMSEVEE